MQDWDHVRRVLAVASLQELQQETAVFARRMGFDHHGFAVRWAEGSGRCRGDFLAFHDYRNEWGRGYAALADPDVAARDARVGQARRALPAVSWNRLGHFAYAPPASVVHRARQQVGMAGDFGISGGITIPGFVRGAEWAFLTFSSSNILHLRDFDALVGPSVHFVSALQASLDRLLRGQLPHVQLSRREAEVLRWVAVGKTSWEISQILGVSERTVNFHVGGACRKLGVPGRRAACTRAVALGLIAI